MKDGVSHSVSWWCCLGVSKQIKKSYCHIWCHTVIWAFCAEYSSDILLSPQEFSMFTSYVALLGCWEVNSLVFSHVDYCNGLLAGVSKSIDKLYYLQNSAARVLSGVRAGDHINPVLESLHLLPVRYRIDFKILMFAFKALHNLSPQYLTDLLLPYTPLCNLSSSLSGLLFVVGLREFSPGWHTLKSLLKGILHFFLEIGLFYHSPRVKQLGFNVFECIQPIFFIFRRISVTRQFLVSLTSIVFFLLWKSMRPETVWLLIFF